MGGNNPSQREKKSENNLSGRKTEKYYRKKYYKKEKKYCKTNRALFMLSLRKLLRKHFSKSSCAFALALYLLNCYCLKDKPKISA